MATVVKNLSSADQNLTYTEQKKIAAAKKAYNEAKANNDTAGMEKAHADAEAIRISEGYYGGTDGTGRTKTTGWKYTGGKLDTGSLSATDKALITNSEDQQRIVNLKKAYAAATDQKEKDYINSLANSIRASYGYSGGKTGSDKDCSVLAYGQGGKSYDQIKGEWDAYVDKWYKPEGGWRWTNGLDVDMNVRTKANRVRQQMEANEKAMAGADATYRELLHKQNEALAGMLPSTTWNADYNNGEGRWETWNPNLGYGYNMNATQANIRNDWKKFYGYTDEQIDNWANDTSHYYNFVDVMAPARNSIDESSGFTGRYAQFINGPYASLISPGSRTYDGQVIPWETQGEMVTEKLPEYDENGNIIKTAPVLNNNNNASAYQRQFLPVAVNGILAGSGPKVNPMDPTTGNNNIAGQREFYVNHGTNELRSPDSSTLSGGTYDDYLRQIYGEALAAQLKVLQSGYEQNLSELDASQQQVDAAYTEQKRQTSGQSAQNAAAWREVANAYGLNSGAVGQASLAQRNQLQNDMNKLNAAQAAARTELQRQRMLLGRQYQLAIEAAVAENNGQLAKSLYQEAVRAEESLQQQEQFYANLALQYGKSMMSFAKSAGSGLSRVE